MKPSGYNRHYKPRKRKTYTAYSRRKINWGAVAASVGAVLLVVLGYFSASLLFRPSSKVDVGSDAPLTSGESGVVSEVGKNDDNTKKDLSFSCAYIPIESVSTLEGLNSTIDMCHRAGFNSALLIMKNETGILAYQSANETAIAVGSSNPQSMDIKTVISRFKENNIYLIAKIDCFKDNCAPKADGNLSVNWTGGGRWWNTYYWMNPYTEAARKYLAGISTELIDLGFNEIMLDEVKFPDSGPLDILSVGDKESGIPKQQMLTQFVNEVCDAVHAKNGKVSLTLPAPGVYTEKVNEYSGEEYNFSALKIDYLSPDFRTSQLKLTYKANDIAPELFTAADESPLPVFEAVVAKTSSRLTAEGASCKLRPIIQDYNTPSRPLLPQDISSSLSVCKVHGCQGYIAYNMSGIYTESVYTVQ